MILNFAPTTVLMVVKKVVTGLLGRGWRGFQIAGKLWFRPSSKPSRTSVFDRRRTECKLGACVHLESSEVQETVRNKLEVGPAQVLAHQRRVDGLCVDCLVCRFTKLLHCQHHERRNTLQSTYDTWIDPVSNVKTGKTSEQCSTGDTRTDLLE